VAQAIAT